MSLVYIHLYHIYTFCVLYNQLLFFAHTSDTLASLLVNSKPHRKHGKHDDLRHEGELLRHSQRGACPGRVDIQCSIYIGYYIAIKAPSRLCANVTYTVHYGEYWLLCDALLALVARLLVY